MSDFTPEALTVIRKASSYSEGAKNLAEKLLSTSSEKSENLTEIENENILDIARTFAQKYSFEIPEDTQDKDRLINVLLKLIITVSTEQENVTSAVFDESAFADDDINPIDDEELDADTKLAEVKAKYSNLIASTKFSTLRVAYSMKEHWQNIPKEHRKIFASMLMDTAVQHNEENYPSFWQEF